MMDQARHHHRLQKLFEPVLLAHHHQALLNLLFQIHQQILLHLKDLLIQALLKIHLKDLNRQLYLLRCQQQQSNHHLCLQYILFH